MSFDPVVLSKLFDQSIVIALGSTLLHFLWQGALIGALYWALDRHLQRNGNTPQSRYLLAIITQTLLLLTPVAWFAVSLHNLATASTASLAGSAVVAEATRASAASISSGASLPGNVLLWTVAVWLLGVSYYSLRLALGALGVHQIARRTTPASPCLQTRVDVLARQIGVNASVQLLLCGQRIIPATVGFLKPVIIMPACIVTRLSQNQLELIVLHELAHIRRHDYLVNLLQLVIETLLFYHPVVRWVGRRARIEREHCCDDMVVALSRQPVDYAYALTELETARQPNDTLAMAASGGDVVSRVRRMLQPERMSRQRGFLASGLLMICMALISLIAASQWHGFDRSEASTAAGTDATPAPHFPDQARNIPAPIEQAPRPAITQNWANVETLGSLSDNASSEVVPDESDAAQSIRPAQQPPTPRDTAQGIAQPASAPTPLGQPEAANQASGSAQMTATLQTAAIGTPTEARPTQDSGPSLTDEPIDNTARLAALSALPSPLRGTSNPPATGTEQAPSTAPSEPTQPAQSRYAGPPAVLYQVEPQYPRSALRQGIEGWVQLAVSVDQQGRVVDLEVVDASSPSHGFIDAARSAVRQWRFDTVAEAGHTTTVNQTIEFSLSEAEKRRFCSPRTGSRVPRC